MIIVHTVIHFTGNIRSQRQLMELNEEVTLRVLVKISTPERKWLLICVVEAVAFAHWT